MESACGTDKKEIIREVIEKKPSKTPYSLAVEYGISELDVMRCLPENMVKEVSMDEFDEIIEEVSKWGGMTMIVQNGSTILEVKAPFPQGTYGHGFYNIESKDSPIGGHIKTEEISAVFFVSKPFMGIETHSIQFFNLNGNSIFKLYLGRDENRQINTDQKEKFFVLKDRF